MRLAGWGVFGVLLLCVSASSALGVSGGVGPVYSGDFARAAAVQSDGKIVVAGMTNGGGATAPLRVMVSRYLPDGSLDPAFGSGGVVRTKLRSFAAVRAVAIQSDGRIVMAGDGVIRYLPDGSVDQTFGVGGVAELAPGGGAAGLALEPDGTINVLDESGALLRLAPNGARDVGFGTGGKLEVDASQIAVQPDGKIVLAARSKYGSCCMLLKRLLADGSPDRSFAESGVATISVGPVDSNGVVTSAISVEENGAIVAGGFATSGGRNLVVLVRLRSDGSPDSSFGGDGVVLSLGPTFVGSLPSLATQADGGIIVVGAPLVRYDANGAVDTSFSGGFQSKLPLADPVAVFAQPGGKVVVVGSRNGPSFRLARYLPNGTLDPSFSGQTVLPSPNPQIWSVDLATKARTPLTANPAIERAVAPSPDGSMLAFVSWRDGQPDIYVMHPDGTGLRRLTTSPFGGSRVFDYWVNSGAAKLNTTIAWSPDGSKIAFDAENAETSPACSSCSLDWRLYVMKADGSDLHLVHDNARDPSWSPDGSRLAFEQDDKALVGVVTVDGSKRRVIAHGFFPSWAPRGNRIVFLQGTYQDTKTNVAVVNADGTGLHRLARNGWEPFWSSDGTRVGYADSSHGPRNGDIYVVKAAGGAPRRLSHIGVTQGARWSPTGSSIAVSSGIRIEVVNTTSGKARVVATAPKGGALVGDPAPFAWSPDGDHLYYTVLTG